MSIHTRRITILLIVAAIAFIAGRQAFRAALNFLLGGTLFGGNIL